MPATHPLLWRTECSSLIQLDTITQSPSLSLTSLLHLSLLSTAAIRVGYINLISVLSAQIWKRFLTALHNALCKSSRTRNLSQDLGPEKFIEDRAFFFAMMKMLCFLPHALSYCYRSITRPSRTPRIKRHSGTQFNTLSCI